MKKQSISLMMTFAAALLITFSACKKDAEVAADTSTTESTTQSQDQSNFSNEMDAVDNDADAAMESDASISGRIASLCDATVVIDTTSVTVKTVTINYDGTTTCRTDRARSGSIVLSMLKETKWKDLGAAVTITFHDFKITRASDSKTITLNGTRTITNVSGGKLTELANLPNGIVHDISSEVSIQFDNGTARTWHVAKRRVYTAAAGSVRVSITGIHTELTHEGIAEWGTDRLGREFTTQIVQAIVLTACAERLQVSSGQILYTQAGFPITMTFGLDASGAATSCPGATGHYYYKAEWTNLLSVAHSVIVAY